MSKLAVALVHYRTPELVAPAVAALREDAGASGLELEIALVDNGSEERDREAWRGLGLARIESGGNAGYAGGVRRGFEATAAPLVVAMNPDVEVRRGCLAALVEALESGADAAGPELHWDGAGRVLLPPTEERTLAAELLSILAARGFETIARRARRRWRRHARRHWDAVAPIASTSLSGALLAFRRDAWNRIGPFDEGYRLYFEETDWLLRLARAGGRSLYVPAARAAHWHARSSFREPAAAVWFAEAEQRFRRRRYGSAGSALLSFAGRLGAPEEAAEAALSAEAKDAPPEVDLARLGLTRPPAWIEISPRRRGFPAAGARTNGVAAWRPPADVWRREETPPLWLRAVDARGVESGPIRLGASGAAP